MVFTTLQSGPNSAGQLGFSVSSCSVSRFLRAFQNKVNMISSVFKFDLR